MKTFDLSLLSETNTTVTLGWTPPSGVEWYLFYAEDVRVSNAPPVDKTGKQRTSVKFSKGPSYYRVVAVVKA